MSTPIRGRINRPVRQPPTTEQRVIWAEQRIEQLEVELQRTKKKLTSGVATVSFVILALVVYHFSFVRPIARAHESLVKTFNENVERYNESLFR